MLDMSGNHIVGFPTRRLISVKRQIIQPAFYVCVHSSVIYDLFPQVVKQCCATDGVEPQYIKDDILPPFFKHFWNQRMALDRRNYRQVCVMVDIIT